MSVAAKFRAPGWYRVAVSLPLAFGFAIALTAAVRAAASGESVISPEMLARLLPRLQRGGSANRSELTEREREVLSLLADGLSNAAIADKLTVSVHTVRNHISNLSAKLGAHSKLEALSIAVRDGLLPDL